MEGRGLTHSKSNAKRRTVASMRLVAMDGQIFYLAKVASNLLPMAFRLDTCEPRRALFTNPSHDFPKSIDYSLAKNGELIVVVGHDQAQQFTLVFASTFARYNCS